MIAKKKIALTPRYLRMLCEDLTVPSGYEGWRAGLKWKRVNDQVQEDDVAL